MVSLDSDNHPIGVMCFDDHLTLVQEAPVAYPRLAWCVRLLHAEDRIQRQRIHYLGPRGIEGLFGFSGAPLMAF